MKLNRLFLAAILMAATPILAQSQETKKLPIPAQRQPTTQFDSAWKRDNFGVFTPTAYHASQHRLRRLNR